jgi:hypothetical protein
MFYLRILTAQRAYYGNDIEAERMVQFAIFKIVVDGKQQVALLTIMYCRNRVGEVSVPSCLYFHKNDGFVLQCNDVNIAMP